MRLKNNTEERTFGIAGCVLAPGQAEEFTDEICTNAIVRRLIEMGQLSVVDTEPNGQSAKGSADELIASIKNAREPRVLEMCAQYGVDIPEGYKLPELKKALTAKLTEAGDGDGTAEDTASNG